MKRALALDGVSDRVKNLPDTWLIASTCSGSGTFELASNSVARALSDEVDGLTSEFQATRTMNFIS